MLINPFPLNCKGYPSPPTSSGVPKIVLYKESVYNATSSGICLDACMNKVFIPFVVLSCCCIGGHSSGQGVQGRSQSDQSGTINAEYRKAVFSAKFLTTMKKRAKEYEDLGAQNNDSLKYLAAIDARRHIAAGAYDVEKEIEEVESLSDRSPDSPQIAPRVQNLKESIHGAESVESAQKILEDYRKIKWPNRIALWELIVSEIKD